MRHTAVLPLLLLCLATAAAAQEERAIDNFAGVGIRAMGMGGAYAGVADDFSATFWNPAGLAQMQQREVYVAFLRNSKDNAATRGRGTAFESRAAAQVTNSRFGSLGFVFPFPVYRGSFVLAAGFHRVKDFDWALNLTSPVVYDASDAVISDSLAFDDRFLHEGGLTVTSVAAAVDVTPSVSLGLTLSLIDGDDESTSEFESLDSEDFYEERRLVDREEFLDDYNITWQATIGAMVRSPRDDPRWRLGATITTGPTHKVSYTFRAPPLVANEISVCDPEAPAGTRPAFSIVECDDGRVFTSPSQSFDTSYQIDLPLSFGLAGSFRPRPDLLLAAAVDATEWTQTEYADGDPFELRANTSFQTQYDDILRWHLGAEWQVPRVALDLRAGYYTDPLPFVGPRDPDRVPDPETNPVVRVVRDRRYVTVGAGLALEEAVRFETAYTRGRYQQAEGEGRLEQREEATIDRLFLGVSYRF